MDAIPRLLPLLEAGPWLAGAHVLAVDRHQAYAAVAHQLGLEEIGYLREAPGRRFAGGSESRYQRHLEEARKAHVHRAVRLLTDNVEPVAIDHLVLISSAELLPLVEEALPAQVARAVVGRLTADRIHERSHELLSEVEESLDRHVADLDGDLLTELGKRLGRGHGAVSGVDMVVQAVYEQQVETLMLARAFEVQGAQCPNCGWLATSTGDCPIEGSPLRSHPQLGELLVRHAAQQSAGVRVLDSRQLDEFRAAAILRLT
jgi:hypothetical protein